MLIIYYLKIIACRGNLIKFKACKKVGTLCFDTMMFQPLVEKSLEEKLIFIGYLTNSNKNL